MTGARLLVEQAGPLTTIQDRGRPGMMRFGVPLSGPVDRVAHAAGAAAVGASPTWPSIELSLGGIILRCLEGEIAFSVAGNGFRAAVDGADGLDWTRGSLTSGMSLRVTSGNAANWGLDPSSFANEVALVMELRRHISRGSVVKDSSSPLALVSMS